MAGERQRYALQTIFSFFLGLMVAAFIGVAVNTFYPSPDVTYRDQLQALQRQQEDIEMTRDGKGALSPENQAKLQAVRDQLRVYEDRQQVQRERWARDTSIILISFATLVMGVSLVRSEELRVISNGLLLGGLFTMVYGTGWVIASGSSKARFFVMTFALVVTVGLGYLKFVRGRRPAAGVAAGAGAAGPAGSAAPEDIGELTARLTALERRAAAAAAALGEAPRESGVARDDEPPPPPGD